MPGLRSSPVPSLSAAFRSSRIDMDRAGPRTRLRLFCFPYAGGGAAVYRGWSAYLPPEVQLCAVHLPGRGNRFGEPAVSSAGVLVETLAADLGPYFDLPFAFFGHSMGALVGFELTRHLRDRGLPLPEHLLVSGRRAPQRPNEKRPLHALPEDEFLHELRELDGTPEEILREPELMELFSPILRADFQLCETYAFVPGEPLEVPITAFGGLEDRDVTRDDLLAWREHTRGGFRLRMFPGGHFFLHAARQSLVHAVAEELMRPVAR